MADDESTTPKELEQTKPGSDEPSADQEERSADGNATTAPPPPPPPSGAPDAAEATAVAPSDDVGATGPSEQSGPSLGATQQEADSTSASDADKPAADDSSCPQDADAEPAPAQPPDEPDAKAAQEDQTSNDAVASEEPAAAAEPETAKDEDEPAATAPDAAQGEVDAPETTDADSGEGHPATDRNDGAVATRADDPLDNVEDDGLFPCFMCGREFLLEELDGHYADCAPLYHKALDNLSAHPLCGLVSRNVAPEQPDWNQAEDSAQASEWRVWYKRETLRVLLGATVMCRGCGSRFVQRDIGAHFSSCNREAPSLSGSPIVVRYSPQRSR